MARRTNRPHRLGGAVCAVLSIVLACALLRAVSPVAGTVFAAGKPPATVTLEHPDTQCRSCHQSIYDAYQQTPMARGSGLAAEGFDARERKSPGFTHEASGVSYEVAEHQGQVTLTYDRPRTDQRDGLHGSDDLIYFIGSGKRGRTFLFQQQNLWFEVPINWYGKKRVWDMAPAYDNATSMPDPLPVDANCLHCHAGAVQASVGGVRNAFAGPPFKAGGVGCAACHGDPAAHLANPANPILNPDKLAASRRDATCLQCHLEGDAVVYRPGKSLAGFAPGQDLSAFAVYFVDRNRAQQGGRASSQYEALLRSACMRGAGDKLTCTTCHDPHSAPPPQQRVAFFRAKCLACHTAPALASTHHPEQQDCASCHMPTRKTLDISHEQLTDHDIEARPQTITPLIDRNRSPELVPVGSARVTIREEGLAYAQLAQHGDRQAGQRALQLLLAAERGGAQDRDVRDQLGFLLQRSGSPSAAAEQYLAALKETPDDTTAAANLAVLDAARAQLPESMRLLQQVVDADPAQTSAGLNLAFLQCRTGRKAEARRTVETMLRFNPDSQAAHRFLDTGSYSGQTCPLQ